MFLVFLWLVGTICSLIIAGSQLGADDADVMNQLMVIRVAKVGTWTVPVPNTEFFTHGISTLFQWDFSFLAGSYLLWFLYLLNIAMAFIFLGIFVGVIYSIFT